jgi:hypothetical protein
MDGTLRYSRLSRPKFQAFLELAKTHNREVWFDVHIGTDGPGKSREYHALPTYVTALQKVANGAKHKVVVFEFNAGNHQRRRALANAQAIHLIERLGLPIATSANCLQPDGQNDNGWDQGLLFLNPSQTWLQPPGYVTQMVSRNYVPLRVYSEVQSPGDILDVSAKLSEDGKALVIQVVNIGDQFMSTAIRLSGFTPSKPTASVEELSGPLNAVNTAEQPHRLIPKQIEWQHEFSNGTTRYVFAPYSFTVLKLD